MTGVQTCALPILTKYMLKICEKWPDFRGKVMCSAGIGSNYETSYNAKRNRYRGKETIETYKLEDKAGRRIEEQSECTVYHDDIQRRKLPETVMGAV